MASFETTNAVLEDWRGIVNYTLETYGEDQTVKYTGILQDCMDAMARGQGHFRDMDVAGHSVRVKHCQKHYIFGLLRKNEPMLILAIFHERMDLMKKLRKRLS